MANIPDPITRTEQYCAYLAGESSYLPEPITREEKYLYYLCVNGGGGSSSGGTTNYNDLTNKPTINGVEVSGSKTSADCKISAEVTRVDHGTADTTFQLPPNELHIWGEVQSLTLALGAETSGVVNGYWFSFDSGDTATTLSLPDTVKTDIVIEPNMHYECLIVGNYMTFSEWEVTA